MKHDRMSLLASALKDIELADEQVTYPDRQEPWVMYLRAIAKALVAESLNGSSL